MIKFTQTQKDEFDKLYEQRNELTLYDAMKEVRNHELLYPVMYMYLFNSGDSACENQKVFSTLWIDPTQITVEAKQYYLLIFMGMYISLDPDKNVCFTIKSDYSKAYQKQFTQAEIDELQGRPEFANRVALDQCKIEVSADDENNPIKPDMPDESGTNEDFDEDKSEPVPPDPPEVEEPTEDDGKTAE